VTSLVYLAAWMLDMGKAIRGSGGATGGMLGPSVLHEEVCRLCQAVLLTNIPRAITSITVILSLLSTRMSILSWQLSVPHDSGITVCLCSTFLNRMLHGSTYRRLICCALRIGPLYTRGSFY